MAVAAACQLTSAAAHLEQRALEWSAIEVATGQPKCKQDGWSAAQRQQRLCIDFVDWRELSIVSRTLVINSLNQWLVVEYSQMIVMWNGRTRPEG